MTSRSLAIWILCGVGAIVGGATVGRASNPVGELVPTFGNGGVVVTSFGPASQDIGAAIAYDASGRLLVAGGAQRSVAVARYRPDGTLDPTFGLHGRLTFSIGADTDDDAAAIAVGGDGRIVLGGISYSFPDAASDAILVALTPDGRFDKTFAGGGVLRLDLGSIADTIEFVAVRPDGRILAIARTLSVARNRYELVLLQFTRDGSPDASFGVGGRTQTHFESIYVHAVVNPDGSVTAFGQPPGSALVRFARFTPTGRFDPTFGTSGIVTTPLAAPVLLNAMARTPDGALALCGVDFTMQLTVARFTHAGTLDRSFAIGGMTTTPVSGMGDSCTSIAVQPDGRIVGAGVSRYTGAEPPQFIVLRYTPRGALDLGFGTGGITLTPIGIRAEIHSMVLLPQGDIAVAGITDDGHNRFDFAVARYYGN